MLKVEKISFFKEALRYRYDESVGNYGDELKHELYVHFFDSEKDIIFSFLNQYNSKKEIYDRVDFVVSKIVMLEDEMGKMEIFYEYF